MSLVWICLLILYSFAITMSRLAQAYFRTQKNISLLQKPILFFKYILPNRHKHVIIGIYTNLILGGMSVSRKSSEDARKKILSVCVQLFIEKGYKETIMAEIVKTAGVSNSTFQNIFHSKDGVLMDLTEFMFENQFDVAMKMLAKYASLGSAYLYAVETAIQLTLVELNENLREIYVEAYTFPKTMEYIYEKTSTVNYQLFHQYLPDHSESDFYEMEIGTGGIMRSYMAKPCNKYFTLEKKLDKFLEMTLAVYHVPEEDITAIRAFIAELDIKNIANTVMQELFKTLSMKFEFELGGDKKKGAIRI